MLAADGVDAEGVRALAGAATEAGARVQVVAPHLGVLVGDGDVPLPATKAFLTAQSVEFDAVVVAGGPGAEVLAVDPFVAMTIAAWGAGREVLTGFGVPADGPGVVLADAADEATCTTILRELGHHRHWERASIRVGPTGVRAVS